MRRRALAAGLAFTFAASFLAARSVAASAQSYSLKRTYKAGESDRYRTVITMETENPNGTMTVEFTIVTTENVKDVKPDGSATVETKVDNASMLVKDKVNTASRELNDSSVVTTTIDSAGKETKREVLGDNGQPGQPGPAFMMLGLVRAAAIPPRSMKAGEDYKYDIPPADAKSSRRAGTVTVVGVEKAASTGADALKVRCSTVVTSPDPAGEKKLTIASTVLLDPATGKTLEVEGSGSGWLGTLDAKKITIRQQHLKDAGK